MAETAVPPIKRHCRRKPTPKLRLAIYQRANFACQICGLQFPYPEGYDGSGALALPAYNQRKRREVYWRLELDHIFPRHLGGRFTLDNLQALCSRCNAIKGAKV